MDRERRAYRLELDAAANGVRPARAVDCHGLPMRGDEKEAKHMARERREGRTSTGFDWEQALRDYGHQCAFCGVHDEPLTVDHIVPISRGGGNWQWNVRPLCAPCNGNKGSRLDAEFPAGRKI